VKRLIELALGRPRTVTVAVCALIVLGGLALTRIAVDVLPVYNSPAVQVLTFYSGMPAAQVASTITNRLERWTGTAGGMRRQESRSILGASIIRNYFQAGVDPNGALTQVNSLALGEVPNLPPGTLPPVVLPYDPTGTVPAVLVTVDSDTQGEATLYDVARYEVRNMIMSSPGANAPVVYGGKVRAVLAYLDPVKLQARGLSPMDVLDALANYNPFIPTGDIRVGSRDYAINSNSMIRSVARMADIPLRVRPGSHDFLGDVATPKDSSLLQTNIVRVNGRREVYIPVYRQPGASTLRVVDDLKAALPGMVPRLTRPGIRLKPVMDQSVYVRQSIRSLAVEAGLGAVLCSLVILIFLGEWRMTAIAVLMIPIAVLASILGLYATDNSINVMTLAGIALAIGPLVDTAIVCLENTHRHMEAGRSPSHAAFVGAEEVIMPELVATFSTLLVLAPLALLPGSGQFLFRPLVLAVTFAMLAALVLALAFVPSRSAAWLRAHGEVPRPRGRLGQAWARFGGWAGRPLAWARTGIDAGVRRYMRVLDWALGRRVLVIVIAAALLAGVIVGLGWRLRREFFPEVDAGAFEIYVRADSGTRLYDTERKIAQVEQFIRDRVGSDLELIISELGVNPDWSAAFTPNAGPMDTVVRVQLTAERQNSAQEYARRLRAGFADDPRFAALSFAFNTSGMMGSALNHGRTTPINVRIEAKDRKKAHAIAVRLREAVSQIDGVVDARVMQRLDYPEYFLAVDRAKARDLGLTQEEVMKNVVAALNSSIQFNKKNFWIDPVSNNQYYVGVQYPPGDIRSLETLLNVSITSPVQPEPIPLSNLVTIRPRTIAAEVTHTDLQTTTDVTLGVEGRDLGHVADDVASVVARFGQPAGAAEWLPYDPADPRHPLEGGRIILTGQYERMQETFSNFGLGLVLALLFVYFLMVVLLDSYLVPLVVLVAVPVGLVGVLPMLYLTGTALNVQSLLGIIFMVGIVVANTVLLTDFAENLRLREELTPTEAIRRAAALRVRPVVMTALAALFALIPMALAVERGSEANAPLGRAVIGGLIAGLFTTLLVVPALYSLVVRPKRSR
jgi:multidrug efflux pump subunit AcrB